MMIGWLCAVLRVLLERAGFHLTIRSFQPRFLAERLSAFGGSMRKVVAHLRQRIVRGISPRYQQDPRAQPPTSLAAPDLVRAACARSGENYIAASTCLRTRCFLDARRSAWARSSGDCAVCFASRSPACARILGS